MKAYVEALVLALRCFWELACWRKQINLVFLVHFILREVFSSIKSVFPEYPVNE